MKYLIAVFASIFFAFNVYANDMDEVKLVIENYADYDNTYNADGLNDVTDESFHFILHSAGETETIRTISRDAFLKGIAAKQFGGNNKALKIEDVKIKANIANVYFTHSGEQATFHHFMNLVKLNGKWKAAATTAHIEIN